MKSGSDDIRLLLSKEQGVQFITRDAAAELEWIKKTGDGMMVAYGEGIAATLLNSGRAEKSW